MNIVDLKPVDFEQAMASVERLRLMGVLVRGPRSLTEICVCLSIDPRKVSLRLTELESAGLVSKENVLFYLSKLDQTTLKLLAAYLSKDGSIRQIPTNKPAKLKGLLNYLITVFTAGVFYTEKEVNMMIRQFHVDTAGLRRDLIDAGLLERESDGSAYWRPE